MRSYSGTIKKKEKRERKWAPAIIAINFQMRIYSTQHSTPFIWLVGKKGKREKKKIMWIYDYLWLDEKKAATLAVGKNISPKNKKKMRFDMLVGAPFWPNLIKWLSLWAHLMHEGGKIDPWLAEWLSGKKEPKREFKSLT